MSNSIRLLVSGWAGWLNDKNSWAPSPMFSSLPQFFVSPAVGNELIVAPPARVTPRLCKCVRRSTSGPLKIFQLPVGSRIMERQLRRVAMPLAIFQNLAKQVSVATLFRVASPKWNAEVDSNETPTQISRFVRACALGYHPAFWPGLLASGLFRLTVFSSIRMHRWV